MQHYEIAIIGFGKGGKTLAAKLAGGGKKVALIEESEYMYGGTCINVGCIPSKSLVKSASYAKKEPDWQERRAYYEKSIKEAKQLSAMLREKNYNKLASLENITLYLGRASFIDENTLNIQGKENLQIKADKIYINTGATPIIPNIQGLKESKNALVSKELMSLEILPQRLAIIGGGYIALEFASIYASFGAKVTLLQRDKTFLGREDKDIADSILQSLEHKDIDIQLGIEFGRIEDKEQQSVIYFKKDGVESSLLCDKILVATGRKPNSSSLECDKIGIRLDAKGGIIVNEYLQTNKEHIYALGDVNGGLQFTYISLDDYRIAYAPFSHHSYTTTQRKAIPYSVFLDPPFSRVGLNEKEALNAGYEIKIAKLSTLAIPKAQVLQKTQGLLKVVINKKSDKILGAMLLCEESYEMINLIKLAMDSNLPYQALRDQIYTHPTMSESFNDLFDV